MKEPDTPAEDNWPGLYDADYAMPIRNVLQTILESFVR
jgi:hypothetical protein